jgi:hypothetical protein
MKTSTKIFIAMIILMIAYNFLMMNQLFLKGQIKKYLGDTDTMFVKDLPYKNFSHLHVTGNYWQQKITIRKSNTFEIETPKNDTARRHIKFNQIKDTLFIDIDMPEGYQYTGVWIKMPVIKSVYSNNANCDIHLFRLDTLVAEVAGQWGMIWLDEDTIQNFSISGNGKTMSGVFEKTVIGKAKLNFSGTSTFTARGCKFDSVEQHIGKEVKMKISGISLQKIH